MTVVRNSCADATPARPQLGERKAQRAEARIVGDAAERQHTLENTNLRRTATSIPSRRRAERRPLPSGADGSGGLPPTRRLRRTSDERSANEWRLLRRAALSLWILLIHNVEEWFCPRTIESSDVPVRPRVPPHNYAMPWVELSKLTLREGVFLFGCRLCFRDGTLFVP
jgi:hypothetical protein